MNLLELEKEFSFESFTNEQALKWGLNVLDIIKEENLKPVRIRVKKDDDIIFQYSFERFAKELSDLGSEHRKVCVVTETKVASLYLEELIEKIMHGEISDSKTVAGLFAYQELKRMDRK